MQLWLYRHVSKVYGCMVLAILSSVKAKDMVAQMANLYKVFPS